MIRHLVKMLILTLAVILVVSSLALAAGPIMGTVAAIDKKGIATVKTDEGKAYRVSGKGLHPGDAGECTAHGKKGTGKRGAYRPSCGAACRWDRPRTCQSRHCSRRAVRGRRSQRW